MKNVDSFLDSLLSEFTSMKSINRAYEMVQVRSQKVFEELDDSKLSINEKREHLELEFRSVTPQHSMPTRKIDCFGQYQETIITKEEIDSLRKERAYRAEMKMKQLQEASQKRKLDRMQAWKKTQQLQTQKPLYQLLQEQENEVLKMKHEEFQKKLQQIKQERKPLRKQDFEEHQKKFCDLIIQPRHRSFESPTSKQQNTLSPEKSIYYLKVEQEKAKLKELEIERKIQLQELQERKKNFSADIKNKFRPKLSLEKHNELIELQNRLHHKPDYQRYQLLANRVRAKKISYQYQDTDEETRSLINFTKSKDQNTSCDMASQDTQLPRFKHRSFLIETNTHQQNYWQKVALNRKISNREKNQMIIEEAKKLEELSRKQEQLARAQGQECIQADNFLISSIKAKLTVLEN